jgi:hypothetical protein
MLLATGGSIRLFAQPTPKHLMKSKYALIPLFAVVTNVCAEITVTDAAPTSAFFRGISELGIQDEAGKNAVKTMLEHIAKGTHNSPAAQAVLASAPDSFRAYYTAEVSRPEGAPVKAPQSKFPLLGGEWKIATIELFQCLISIDPVNGRIKGEAIDERNVDFIVSGKIDPKEPNKGSFQLTAENDRKFVRDYFLEVITTGSDQTFRITLVKNGGLFPAESFEMSRLQEGTIAARRKQQKDLLKIVK